MAPETLLDLPNELILAIKDCFDPHDLLDNVCFGLLCKRTAACYAKLTNKDWMLLCRANGLGRGTYEGPELAPYYGGIAISCALHAWSCTHPACGKARLAENRESRFDRRVRT